jgi:DNA mismatch repair protein MutS2
MDEKSLKILEYHKVISLLAENTVSKMGQERAEALKPFTKYILVKKALEETDEAVKLIQRGRTPNFGGLKDIRSSLKKVSIGGILEPKELLDITDLLRASRNLSELLCEKDDKERYPNLYEISSNINVIKTIEDRINKCIVNEEEVSDAASPRLASLRREIRSLNDGIRQKLNSIIRSSVYKKYLQESIVTLRGDRYVVPVKQEFRGSFPGIVHDQSSSGATLFIEPIDVVNFNNDLKRLKLKENEEINKILAELTVLIFKSLKEISRNVEILGELDFIFAKAELSVKMEASAPIINHSGSLKIRGARHPLLTGDVVPVDIHLGDKFAVLVITGPNTGGKTVVLKTVGLLCLMTQSGLHIPARWGSELPVFTDIFADIGDEQSIEQSLSTFSSHMTNVVKILKKANPKNLVLLDELGAGTDPDEGAALATAVLETLRQRKVLAIATTHYSELKTYAYTTPGVENASVEFDVETLRPTYRLLIGLPGRSNAFEISSRLGMDDEIINLARGYLDKENMKVEDLLAQLHDEKRAAISDREKVQELKHEIELLKIEYDKQIEEIYARKEKVIRKAHEDADNILRKTKAKAENSIKEINEIYAELKTKEQNRRIEQIRQNLKDLSDNISDNLSNPIISETGEDPREIYVGQNVEIPSLNQKGVVLEIVKEGEAIVQIGVMKINVPLSALKKTRIDERKDRKTETAQLAKNKLQNIPTQIDVRGYKLNEAIQLVDKYLDDAYLAGLNVVTIIHGKGTGALREGILQFLGGISFVESFRLGGPGEGGDGVTIVKLI